MTLNRLQTRWLVWRYQLGWGQLAPYCKIMARALLIFCLAGTFFDILLISGMGAAVQTHDGLRQGSTLMLLCLFLIGQALLLAGGIVRLRQAAQAERGQVEHIHGTCFAVLHPPPRSHPRRLERRTSDQTNPFPVASEMLFARIGSSAQDARWYALPARWHEALENPQVSLEVVVLQGTQWVARLNHRSRLDELRWAATHLPGQWYQASPEEVRTLRHALRRVACGWGQPPRRALRAGLELIGIGVPLGLVLVIRAIVVWVVPGLRPRSFPTLFLVYAAGWMLLVDLSILLYGVFWQGGQMLLAWRRGQQEQETVTLEGRVVGVWPVSGLAFTEGEVHLLQVEQADGTKAAVTVGAAFRALLPEPGAAVRITALAKAEVVTSLQLIPSP
jgi:hypothetical protein